MHRLFYILIYVVSALVNAVIFLAPISAFDQVLEEVSYISSLADGSLTNAIDIGRTSEPTGRFPASLEVAHFQQAPRQCEHCTVLEQM
jgi:hypothetical protein